MRRSRNTFRAERSPVRRRAWLAAEIACAAVALALIAAIAGRLAWDARLRREERASSEALRRATAIAEPAGTPDAAPGGPTGTPSPDWIVSTLPIIDADFDALLRQNADFVGMVAFEDRSLYVCQADDNQFYMTHRFNGDEDSAGMIFMDCRCELNPRSDNLILYGHNMQNGARFGTLRRFENRSHLEKYPVFQFVGLYESHMYRPYAVFHASADAESDAYVDFAQADFATRDDFDAYVRAARERSVYPIDVDVAYGEPLLTLITCSEAVDDRGRLVIACRQLRDGELAAQ